MKRLLLASTSLLLILPDIALAQDAPRPARPTRPAATRPAPGNGGARPQRPVRPNPGGPQIQPVRPGNGGPQIQPPRPGRPGNGGPQIQPPRPNPGGGVRPPRPNPGGGVRPPRPNPGGPGIRPPRPNPGHGVRPPRPPHRPGAGRPPNFRPIHRPGFRYPRGYRYRRWSIGLLLPALFLSSTYYFDDYYDLGVGPPPPGYRWVRYGPDLLLVQIGTRRVADVIYGAFN